MSSVIEIKGIIGDHLHLKVDWQTHMSNMQSWTGMQECIVPISGIILEIDNKGNPLIQCNKTSYTLTKKQFDQIVQILSNRYLCQNCQVNINEKPNKDTRRIRVTSAQIPEPEDLRDDWPHAIAVRREAAHLF